MIRKAWKLLLITCTAVLLTGCGNDTATVDNDAAKDGNADQNKAMGRYIETAYDLPQDMSRCNQATRLDDGSLIIYDYNTGPYVSKDNGASWEKQEDSWIYQDKYAEAYLQKITVASDGSAFLIYSNSTDYSNDTEKVDSGDDTESPENMFLNFIHYLYVDAEGVEKELFFDMSYEKDNYIISAWYFDNRLFGSAIDGKVYEMNTEKGTVQELFAANNQVGNLLLSNNMLIGINKDQAYLYDLENKTLTEDDIVLNEFLDNNLEEDSILHLDYPISLAKGEDEKVIYLGSAGGLFRHVLGGSTMEKVMDGSLSTFGDPSAGVMKMELLENKDFLVQYSNGQYILYHFDETISTVPEKQLKVYSLTDNDIVRQAMAMYRKKNPDVMVVYEVGMDGMEGVTKEDAIKNLNTKMMSGSGPDILILDNMPIRSYMEKGILKDISPLVDSITKEEEYFENILKAFEKEDKISMIPINFRLPIMVGEKDTISKINDLKTLADAVENIRKNNPTGSIIGIVKEEQALKLLGMVCASSWMKEDGSIDQTTLTEFLSASKRIYQAERIGITDQDVEDFEEKSSVSSTGRKEKIITGADEEFYQDISRNIMDIVMSQTKISLGYVSGISLEFSSVTSVIKEVGNMDFKIFDGQLQKSFTPNTFVGMSSKSTENEVGEDFIRLLLSNECQSSDIKYGFPINKKAFQSLLYDAFVEPGEPFGAMGYPKEDGSTAVMTANWPTEEELRRLTEMAETAENPCIVDNMVRDTVYDIGQKALSGELSVEETVAQIIKKSELYLAE